MKKRNVNSLDKKARLEKLFKEQKQYEEQIERISLRVGTSSKEKMQWLLNFVAIDEFASLSSGELLSIWEESIMFPSKLKENSASYWVRMAPIGSMLSHWGDKYEKALTKDSGYFHPIQKQLEFLHGRLKEGIQELFSEEYENEGYEFEGQGNR